MKCPNCGNFDDKVIDSRLSDEGISIRRRRECLKCQARFTTYERLEETPLTVVKKDDRREPFDRNKMLAGIAKACEKRPIARERIEELADKVERTLQKEHEKEVSSSVIGELIMKELESLDEVAYVRFASVYRQFRDVGHFMKELQGLLAKEKKK